MLADKAQKMSTDEFDEYLDDPGKIIEQLTEDFGEKVLAAAIYKDGEGEPTS